MSLPDTIFIFGLALVIFGPKKLPEMGRQLGKLLYEFRRASNEFKAQIEEELRAADEAERSNRAAIEAGLEDSAIPAAAITSSDGMGALGDGSSTTNTGDSENHADGDGYPHESGVSDGTDSVDSEEDWDWDGYKDSGAESGEAETFSSEGETPAAELTGEETHSASDDNWDRGQHHEWDRYGSYADDQEAHSTRTHYDSEDQPFQWEGAIEQEPAEPSAAEQDSRDADSPAAAENALAGVADEAPEEVRDESSLPAVGEESLSAAGFEQPETQTANHHA